jgi:hypothetical protein
MARLSQAFRMTRRARELGRDPRLRPDKGDRCGWRSSGGAELRVMDECVILLRIKTNQGHEEVRRVKVEGIRERGRAQAHSR